MTILEVQEEYMKFLPVLAAQYVYSENQNMTLPWRPIYGVSLIYLLFLQQSI
jgi:hypothetical protein